MFIQEGTAAHGIWDSDEIRYGPHNVMTIRECAAALPQWEFRRLMVDGMVSRQTEAHKSILAWVGTVVALSW